MWTTFFLSLIQHGLLLPDPTRDQKPKSNFDFIIESGAGRRDCHACAFFGDHSGGSCHFFCNRIPTHTRTPQRVHAPTYLPTPRTITAGSPLSFHSTHTAMLYEYIDRLRMLRMKSPGLIYLERMTLTHTLGLPTTVLRVPIMVVAMAHHTRFVRPIP